jgi:hypothetical protein
MIEVSMSKNGNPPFESGEQVRRMSIAVANWLCGAIEGMARDHIDMALAEALDLWLRRQKMIEQQIYTGKVTCSSCGNSWECIVASNDTEQIHCTQCGDVQKNIPIPSAKQSPPENRDALLKVQQDIYKVITKIDDFCEGQ